MSAKKPYLPPKALHKLWNDAALPASKSAVIKCDGSCPANPGPMGIGYVLEVSGSDKIERGFRLGPGTNNQAEYHALISALRHALREEVNQVMIVSDSLLMVNHIEGRWKCKDSGLKPLLEEAKGLLSMFIAWGIGHVPRHENEDADFLSKNPTPHDIVGGINMDFIAAATSGDNPLRLRFTRRQAAWIRWYWQTGRCTNEYRLARIFGGSPSHLGRIGRAEQYSDVTPKDLPHDDSRNSRTPLVHDGHAGPRLDLEPAGT